MLDMVLVLLALAAVGILFLVNQCSQSRMISLAASIPGPKKIPLIGYYGVPAKGQGVLEFRKSLIEKYGHVHKFWQGHWLRVMISDPKDAETVMGGTSANDKGKSYNFLMPWLGTGLLTSAGLKWQMRRKAITPTFHFKILEEFIEIFNRKSKTLLRVIEEKADGQLFNLLPYISSYTLDVICETAMGVEVNAQGKQSSPYIASVRRMCDYVTQIKNSIWIVRKCLLLFKKTGEQEDILRILHGFTNSVIKMKRVERQIARESTSEENSGPRKKTAFLELLLNMSEKPDSSINTDEDIREEVDTFMFEGHDTTSSALSSTIFLLGKHPEIQEKVLEEARYFIQDPDYDLTYQDLQGMKYTECVLKDALRLYPPVPGVSRSVIRDINLPSGHTLPAGCSVTVDIFHMHRHSDYWKNPEQFNPDNFLPEATVGRPPYLYIPFSAGPRNCIGQKFAMLEMKCTLSKFIYKYKVEYGGPESDVQPSASIILQSDNGYQIKLTSRTE